MSPRPISTIRSSYTQINIYSHSHSSPSRRVLCLLCMYKHIMHVYMYLQTIYSRAYYEDQPSNQPAYLPTPSDLNQLQPSTFSACTIHYTRCENTHIYTYLYIAYTETRSRRESTSKLWGGHRPERSIKLLLLLLYWCCSAYFLFAYMEYEWSALSQRIHSSSNTANTYTKHTLTRPPHITLLNYSNIRLDRLANAACTATMLLLRCCSGWRSVEEPYSKF